MMMTVQAGLLVILLSKKKYAIYDVLNVIDGFFSVWYMIFENKLL